MAVSFIQLITVYCILLQVTEIKEMVSYDDKNYRVKVAAEHSNPHITELWHAGYTLKVLNSMDSKKNHVG